MDPSQQYQAPNQGSPYAFIMSPQKPARRRFSLGGGNNFGMTIAIIAGGALLLMLILAIIVNSLGGGNKGNLISLAQTQNELSRVSQQAVSSATQQTTKNLAVTIDLSMSSQQQGTLALLGKRGVKVSPKDLRLKQNATTDQQLASAKTTSTFDSVYTQIMQQSLNDYANTLKQMHDTSKSKSERELTSDYYTQTQLLISQVPYAQQSLTQ